MKRTHIAAAFATALTLGPMAAMAASGDAWYGTNRVYTEGVAPIEVTRVEVERPLIIEERSAAEPIVVEREYLVREPAYVVVTRDDPAYDDRLFYVMPEPDSRIERGLFNRQGPNDFGA